MSDYNGWPNRETWNVMLWLDNEESAYRYYVERVKYHLAKGRKISGMRAKAIAANALGERTGDGISLNNNRIKWTAIAEAMRESAA
jgi:hypothetical protein